MKVIIAGTVMIVKVRKLKLEYEFLFAALNFSNIFIFLIFQNYLKDTAEWNSKKGNILEKKKELILKKVKMKIFNFLFKIATACKIES